MANLKNLYNAVLEGDAELAASTTEEALKEGINPKKIIDEQMIPAMDEVGRRFAANEYYVPELLIAARAMKGALKLMKPLLAKAGAKPIAKVVIGTVKGDLHDIGKNLVAAMLEGGGFEIIDLGVDVAPDKFIATAKEQGAQLICLSALLTTTMGSMKEVVEALKKQGLRGKVKVMIGGAPINQRFADEIGADAYSDNASTAVTAARKLVAA